MGGKLDRAIGDGQPQRRSDGALDQADFAAMSANEFGGNGKPKTGAAGAGRALESFEQMGARLAGKTGAGIGHFDYHDGALAPAGNADLVAAGIARFAAFHSLDGVARQIEEDAKQLVVIGLHDEPALDRADPADRPVGAEPESFVDLLNQRLKKYLPALRRRLLQAAVG